MNFIESEDYKIELENTDSMVSSSRVLALNRKPDITFFLPKDEN